MSNRESDLSKAIERFNFLESERAIVDLDDLFNSCIGDNSTSEGKFWKEFSTDRTNYKQNTKIYLEAEKSLNPLAALASHRILRTKLRSRLRTIWSGQRYRKDGFPLELEHNNWNDLSDDVQNSIRSELKLLATREQTKIRRGRPQKSDLDALVDGLADIFASQTGHDLHINKLPHAVESRFIQFASSVLAGRITYSECTEVALARRWTRIKKHDKTGIE